MKTLLALTLLLPVFASCNSASEPSTSNPTGDLMPLAVGNQWVYQYNRYDSTGATLQSEDVTISLVSTQTLGGISYYTSNLGANYYYTSLGLWSTSHGIVTYIARYPITLGEELRVDSTVITNEQSPDPLDLAIGVQKLVAENAAYTTSFGTTYTTVQYEREYHGTLHDSVYVIDSRYYQLGTGLVWEEHQTHDATGKLYRFESYELKSTTVK